MLLLVGLCFALIYSEHHQYVVLMHVYVYTCTPGTTCVSDIVVLIHNKCELVLHCTVLNFYSW